MYHRGNTVRKQDLVKELQKNEVTFDIRKLNVGDFLWVARERIATDPGNVALTVHNANPQSCTTHTNCPTQTTQGVPFCFTWFGLLTRGLH